MRRILVLCCCAIFALAFTLGGALAKNTKEKLADSKVTQMPPSPSSSSRIGRSMLATATVDTVVLGWWQFDTAGGLPTKQGWTERDMTTQEKMYWHVAGTSCSDAITPIAGTKSMWCGQWPTNTQPWCGWESLPGYGNHWDQSLEAQNVSTLSYAIAWDCETGYDFAYLEWWDPVNSQWVKDATVNSGQGFYTGNDIRFENATSPFGSTKVRVHFHSDAIWSDEDGQWPTAEGAVMVDDLSIDGGPAENWEGEACNAKQSMDGRWIATIPPGFGEYGELHSSGVVQEDRCFRNESNFWGWFDNPAVTNYACGGWPSQGAMPYGPDENGLYLNNEIWSPWVPVVGSGSGYSLQFLTYLDLPLDNLQFCSWHVRWRDTGAGGCPSGWKDHGHLYYGGQKDWRRSSFEFGAFIPSNATDIQVAIGAVDMCGSWCGAYWTSSCHSHAPLIDQVKVLRLPSPGPQWIVRDSDLWQDNFPEEGGVSPGSWTRCDMAQDILPGENPNILPGDSLKVFVADAAGLATDNTGGRPGKAVYAFVKVTDRFGKLIAGKSGFAIQSPDNQRFAADPQAGLLRYPLVPGVAPVGWDAYRMDHVYNPVGTEVRDTYCADLMDLGSGPTGPHYKHANENVAANTGIFEPGDVINYVFAARNVINEWSYMYRTPNGHGVWGRTNDLSKATADPAEWSVLPGGTALPGGHILVVECAVAEPGGPRFVPPRRGPDPEPLPPDPPEEFHSMEEYWQYMEKYYDWYYNEYIPWLDSHSCFYHFRGGSSNSGLASRVKNIQNQMIGNSAEVFHSVIWNCPGQSSGFMGAGGLSHAGSSGGKSDDFALCYTFLNNHPNNPGWAYWGEDVVQNWSSLIGSGAMNVKSTFMNFSLLNGDQKVITGIVSPRVSPLVDSPWTPESFYAFGGCPAVSDFDCVGKTGASLVSHRYNNQVNAPAAVYQATTNLAGSTARFHLAGFDFGAIRDDDTDGLSDYVKYLWSTLVWFQNTTPTPVGIDPVAFANTLEDNYPNPFNPTTTIKYSIQDRGQVTLRIYNAAGQLVRTLVNEEQAPQAGGFSKVWNGLNDRGQSVASGVYFYQLTAKNFEQTKKLVVLK